MQLTAIESKFHRGAFGDSLEKTRSSISYNDKVGEQDYQAVAKMGRSTFQQVVTDWPGINTRAGQSALHSETREGQGKVAGCQRGVMRDAQIMRGWGGEENGGAILTSLQPPS